MLAYLVFGRGRPFHFDKVQLGLLLISLAFLLTAMPRVRQAVAARLAHSRERSSATWADVNASLARQVPYLIWFTAVTSLGEVAYLTYTKEVTRYRVLGFEFMWQVPIGYAIVFAVIGLFVVALARRRRLRALLLIGFAVTACGWLPQVFKGLHGWAVLLLAAGISVQLTRLATAHAYLLDRLVRRTALIAALCSLVLAAGFAMAAIRQERADLARLPPVTADRPNVLLIVLDTVRASSLSLYGHSRATSPNLDRFAAQGTVFDRAYATAPWTLPSHGSMFTGRHPHELSTGFSSPLDAAHPTLAEALAEQGYATSAFVANTWYGGAEFGLGRGFAHYDDHQTTPTTSFMATSFGQLALAVTRAKKHFATHDNFGRQSADDINRGFLGWLSRQDRQRPFFTFLNYCDAHGPYLPPDPFALRFTNSRTRYQVTDRALDAWSPDEIRSLNDAYEGAIAYLDDRLGRLFDDLQARGILQNTVVLITSDHGEHFGEHRMIDHMYSVYAPLLHVPLVVVAPGRVGAGERVDRPVSLREIGRTIFQLSGIAAPSGFPGASLLPGAGAQPVTTGVLSEVEHLTEEDVPAWYPAKRGELKSLIQGDWQYIKNFGDGQEQLFNLVADPAGLRDLAAAEPERLSELRRQLERLLATSNK